MKSAIPCFMLHFKCNKINSITSFVEENSECSTMIEDKRSRRDVGNHK